LEVLKEQTAIIEVPKGYPWTQLIEAFERLAGRWVRPAGINAAEIKSE